MRQLRRNPAFAAHELGVRMALGAPKTRVVGAVVTRGLRLALLGAAGGIVGALEGTRLLRGLLYGITATDPVTFAAVSLILIVVVLVASYLPRGVPRISIR